MVAAGIGCKISAVWEARRETRATRIADDLTHNLLQELTESEVDSYLNKGLVSFPAPVLEWMSNPAPDQQLGRKCLLWTRDSHPALKLLRPSIV